MTTQRTYKPTPKRTESARMRRAKKAQAGLSLTSGAMGLGALGTMGAATALKNPRVAAKVADAAGKSGKLTGASAGLTTSAAGVGGLGSLNFARVSNQEANRLPKMKDGRIVFPNKNVSKSFEGVGMMDFGLSNVRQGQSVLVPQPVSKSNITEYQRRSRDSRRTTNRGKNIAGAGGAAITGAAVIGSRYGAPVGMQTLNAAKAVRGAANLTARGTKAQRAAVPGATSAALKKNPYGAAVLGGAGLMGAGGATAATGRINEKRNDRKISNLRRQRSAVGKARAYDPERSRNRRLDHYSTASAAAGGATLAGGAAQGAKSANSFGISRKLAANQKPGAALRFMSGGLKSGGKAAGLGLAGTGMIVGADRIKSYQKGRGATYNKRSF